MSESKGAIGYDIGVYFNYIIPSQKIGTVDRTSRHLFGQSIQPNYKKEKKKKNPLPSEPSSQLEVGK